MTLSARPMKANLSKKIFFTAVLQIANLHISGLKITVFAFFRVLEQLKEAPQSSWDINNFPSLLQEVNCWTYGEMPQVEVFFQS